MDYRELSKLLIKVAGMVVIVIAITSIPSHINGFLYQGQDTLSNFIKWVLLPLSPPLIVGYLMWSFPGTITNKIIEKNSEQTTNTVSLNEIERVAITTLGLVLMFYALSDIVFNFTYVLAENAGHSIMSTEFRISAENWGHIAGTLVEILFALTLLIKANGVILLLNKLRS